MPPVRRPGRIRTHDVRRLRDLLRSAVLQLPERADLPGESELVATYGSTRGVVREALAMLREEGLIARRQGLGTYTVCSSHVLGLDEAHGVVAPRAGGLLDGRLRARVITREFVALPPRAAQRLDTDAGQRCLLLEYVNLLDDEPVALATNYVVDPEATRVAAAPFRSDWYALLAAADCRVGDSQFVWDAVLADPATAALLAVPPGRPLMSMEQTVHDDDGRAFDVAFIQLRADRWRLMSRFHR